MTGTGSFLPGPGRGSESGPVHLVSARSGARRGRVPAEPPAAGRGRLGHALFIAEQPARRLPRAPAPRLGLPLQPHSNMASSLCACPALFFKIIILCVCAANSFNDLFQVLAARLKPISRRDVAPLPLPPLGRPRAWAHRHRPPHTHSHIQTPHVPTAPSPSDSPRFFPLAPSIPDLQKVPITGAFANPSAGKSRQTPQLTGHFRFCRFTNPPWSKCTNLRFIRGRLVASGKKFNPLRDPGPAHCAPPRS